MTKEFLIGLTVLSSVVVIAACSQQAQPDAVPAASPYRLSSEPADARGVAEVRTSGKEDGMVVVVGRIGGDAKPWVDGMAAFLLTDTSLTPCNARPGDACPTPWDYCCDLDRLKDSKVMVKLVDKQGRVVKSDVRKLLGVKELDTVVIQGRVKRDDTGNVTILADGVYVRS